MKKTLATIAIAAGLIIAPAASGATAAEAANWLPTKPAKAQKIGWGDKCATIKNYSKGRYTHTSEYRWFTTSLGSTCYFVKSYR